MSVFDTHWLLEAAEPKVDEDTITRKLLTSKIKSLNEQLSALVQKKIRIDLEIKRTKKKLTKLKNQSQTYVRAKVELEGLNYDQLNPEQNQILLERWGDSVFQELYDLDEQTLQSIDILKTYEDLPLYED